MAKIFLPAQAVEFGFPLRGVGWLGHKAKKRRQWKKPQYTESNFRKRGWDGFLTLRAEFPHWEKTEQELRALVWFICMG